MDSDLPGHGADDEPDPAALAFAELGEKVERLEAAIATLVAGREAIPDYSETLGEIAFLIDKTRQSLATLARRPALELTPDAIAQKIMVAGNRAREQDAATIAQAKERIDKAAGRMEYLLGRAASKADLRRHLLWSATGGMFAGMLLWAFVPGLVARAMPGSWHVSETMARQIMGEATLWDAGIRMMQADSPQAWQMVEEAASLWRENRTILKDCRKAAAKAGKSLRCTIAVTPATAS
ncbi:DUF6118 family protein [Sphingobium sp. YR768]|uniref:DUF6118 family protein n=1 Tax=Sphingobium sp. YR768 TaxID=1884365 RepID=UPI0008C8A40A|nr:DUF6118 family protein [Sphingobium sp. YR768]SES13680.1 hypothetical protein SAMN05518866_14320 [Sphingobium sp. YR768]